MRKLTLFIGVFFSALNNREDEDVTISDVDMMLLFVDRFGVVCADVDGDNADVFTGGLFSFLSLLIS